MPPVHVCDDACTFVSHSIQRYPVEAELAFGETRGCFEKPDDDLPPNTGLSCPEITPIEHSTREPNREAMLNASPLVHPDVPTGKRYVFCTRLVII